MSERVKEALARLIADVKTCQAAGRKVPTALLREAEAALSPTPPTDAAPPLTIQRLKRHMATLTFVQWDRYVQTAHHVAVYGWIPRPDGRTDFVLIDLDDRGPMWWTSSAEHSAEIGRLLDGEGHHVDCKRVEDVIVLPNVVRLKPPTDAATCPDCEGKVWRKLEVRVGEPGILHSPEPCPTCQPSPRPDAATCLECGGKGEVDSGGQYPWDEWINVPCPTCQRQQDSNEWTPSGSLLPERFVSVTEPPQPQQQPPPQPSADAAQAERLADLVAGIRRIADDYHPDRPEDAALALSEMREALLGLIADNGAPPADAAQQPPYAGWTDGEIELPCHTCGERTIRAHLSGGYIVHQEPCPTCNSPADAAKPWSSRVTDSMNIFAKRGDKVRFAHPDAGYECDQEAAVKHLTVGAIYTIERTSVGNFHTTVWLQEVPERGFNSVQFVDVEPTDAAHYRCERCGERIEDEGSGVGWFHTQTKLDGDGNPFPVQCGPVFKSQPGITVPLEAQVLARECEKHADSYEHAAGISGQCDYPGAAQDLRERARLWRVLATALSPTCQPQQQPPPQQEPLSPPARALLEAVQRGGPDAAWRRAFSDAIPDDVLIPELVWQWTAQLLRHQEQQIRAREQARVVGVLDALEVQRKREGLRESVRTLRELRRRLGGDG